MSVGLSMGCVGGAGARNRCAMLCMLIRGGEEQINGIVVIIS